MKPRIAVFPGSFDPVTLGHVDIVERAANLFDEVIVAIGENSAKNSLYSLEQRLDWLEKTFASFPNVKATTFSGLTMDFCKKNGSEFLIRGLRSTSDFGYERSIAQMNFQLSGVDTYFLISRPEYTHISSSIVRDLIKNGGDASSLLPEEIR